MQRLSSYRAHPAFAIVVFLATAFVMHAALSLPVVQSAFLDPYTAAVAAVARGLLRTFLPAITGTGNVLGDASFRIQVLNVCNGTDLWVLFTAAVVAFPASLRAKLLGLAVGLPVLSVINLTRIIGLYLTGRYAPRLFDTSHLFLWQVALVLVTAGLFALYLRWTYRLDAR
jgi:exosortase H (IPTLxxWG-CTERM-specific)